MTPDDKDIDYLERLLDQLARHYGRQAPPPGALEKLRTLWRDPDPEAAGSESAPESQPEQ